MGWIQSKWAFKTIFRIRKENNLFKWYYFKSWIAGMLQIIDGLIELITFNYIISNISITWLCVTPSHFFWNKYLKRLEKETIEEMKKQEKCT